ncbi:MAG TPA: alginate lyase family protein, partial [Armatimonadota bacterium]|nr:alginate lyase family protein [Armatimonadota bacterium]
EGLGALRHCAECGWVDGPTLIQLARNIRDRRFQIMGCAVPEGGPWPWNQDWRVGHEWPLRHFQDYDYYEPRAVPYDIRIPWELSRLWFLVPLLQGEALDPGGEYVEAAEAILADWEDQNPFAASTGWYPMEASMRAISLVLVLDLLAAMKKGAPAFARALRLAALHGEFIWRTIEYTDVRENHYAANTVALLLLGLALRRVHGPARRWLAYATRHLAAEATTQILPDGVNFEKATGYHRLVTELFLLAHIASGRHGVPWGAEASERLHRACLYSAACRRPDGLAPCVGDGDDAQVLVFDGRPPRDHSPLIALGAAYFGCGRLKGASSSLSAAVPWLMGPEGVESWRALAADGAFELQYFEAGGVVVVRAGTDWLWIDVGEVGLAGRGGHGHNDLLSFELALDGRPVVVDPGCYCYTADPVARDRFRGSAAHNGLIVDGHEMAELSGLWWIADDAKPESVSVTRDGEAVCVAAAHAGYARLRDPVRHTRHFRFDTGARLLTLSDRLHCGGSHEVTRFLHLSPGLRLIIEGHRAWVTDDTAGHAVAEVEWGAGTRASACHGEVSPGYGQREPAEVLELADQICGTVTLSLSIRGAGRATP